MNMSTAGMRHPRLQSSCVVEDQQIGGLRPQLGEDVWSGQCDKSILELSGGQRGEGDRRNRLQDGKGEHRRHPRGKGSVGKREDGAKDALRDGLDGGRGNEGRNVGIEGLGWVKREEICEETGGVRRSHGGTRDSVIGGVASDPGGENGLTYNVAHQELVYETTSGNVYQGRRLQHTCPS